MSIKQLIGAILAALLISGPAIAQQPGPCGARAEIVRQLTGQYGEALAYVGAASSDVLIEVYVAADGASWTLLASSASGVSCLLAAGSAWQPVPAKPAGREG